MKWLAINKDTDSHSHSLYPVNGSRKVLRNVGILPQHCTVSRLRRPRFRSSIILWNMLIFGRTNIASVDTGIGYLRNASQVRQLLSQPARWISMRMSLYTKSFRSVSSFRLLDKLPKLVFIVQSAFSVHRCPVAWHLFDALKLSFWIANAVIEHWSAGIDGHKSVVIKKHFHCFSTIYGHFQHEI